MKRWRRTWGKQRIKTRLDTSRHFVGSPTAQPSSGLQPGGTSRSRSVSAPGASVRSWRRADTSRCASPRAARRNALRGVSGVCRRFYRVSCVFRRFYIHCRVFQAQAGAITPGNGHDLSRLSGLVPARWRAWALSAPFPFSDPACSDSSVTVVGAAAVHFWLYKSGRTSALGTF